MKIEMFFLASCKLFNIAPDCYCDSLLRGGQKSECQKENVTKIITVIQLKLPRNYFLMTLLI